MVDMKTKTVVISAHVIEQMLKSDSTAVINNQERYILKPSMVVPDDAVLIDINADRDQKLFRLTFRCREWSKDFGDKVDIRVTTYEETKDGGNA